MAASRRVSWLKGALKAFETFPIPAQIEMARALSIVAAGRHPDIAKPLKGFGSGVLELALRQRGDAYRVVYALQLSDGVWIIHAFQKKSKHGIKTPQAELDLISKRLKRLRETLT